MHESIPVASIEFDKINNYLQGQLKLPTNLCKRLHESFWTFRFWSILYRKSSAIINIFILLRIETLQEAVVYLSFDVSSLFQVYTQSLEINSMTCSREQPLSLIFKPKMTVLLIYCRSDRWLWKHITPFSQTCCSHHRYLTSLYLSPTFIS